MSKLILISLKSSAGEGKPADILLLVSGIEWDSSKFGLKKETSLYKLFNGQFLGKKIEQLPDKDCLRKALVEDPKTAPEKAELVQKVSLTYNLRKRLKTGI